MSWSGATYVDNTLLIVTADHREGLDEHEADRARTI